MEPVKLEIPIYELEQVQSWIKEAMRPKVTYTGNLDEMRGEAGQIAASRMEDLNNWIRCKISGR